jgi:hypothetical protein
VSGRGWLVNGLTALTVVPFLLGAASAPSSVEHVVFTTHGNQITEDSALVPLAGGLFATTNDSGDTGRVFVLDSSGDTVGVTYWEKDPVDTEALAPAGGDHIWVGDIGDNDSVRSHVDIAEITVGRGTRHEMPTVYPLVYPDGAHNAETLLCDPATGRLYIATKDIFGGALYEVPAHPSASGTNRLVKVRPSVIPVATDGGFLPGGHAVVIRNYIAATIYSWPAFVPERTFALPSQPQGEGIGVVGHTIYLSSEGLHSQVLAMPLPSVTPTGSSASPGSSGSSPSARPSAPSQRPPQAGPGSTDAIPVTTTHTHRDLWPWVLVIVVACGAAGALVVRARR